MEQAVEKIIKQHENSGRYIEVDGIKTFVLVEGSGEAVLCVHGVPTSSFLYRKLVRALSALGFMGISVDMPGFGLSDRPDDFDYTFSGFSRFLAKATEVLGLERYHLVVHDIGGPVGFALAAKNQDKILSITILNTWIDVVNFEKPLPMRPFEKPLLGDIQLASIQYPTWYLMFSTMGIYDTFQIPKEDVFAYVDLLKREDGGRAFLKVMRNFESSEEFRDQCMRAVKNVAYPIQAIWGIEDPGLTFDRYGKEIQKAASLQHMHKLKARHFLQEEKWQEIAELIAKQARSS
jgi:pimeloyl-ACP methyl ester carboxylesterase